MSTNNEKITMIFFSTIHVLILNIYKQLCLPLVSASFPPDPTCNKACTDQAIGSHTFEHRCIVHCPRWQSHHCAWRWTDDGDSINAPTVLWQSDILVLWYFPRFFSSFYIVLAHTANTYDSISHSFVPLWILKSPFSPQLYPQEFTTSWKKD